MLGDDRDSISQETDWLLCLAPQHASNVLIQPASCWCELRYNTWQHAALAPGQCNRLWLMRADGYVCASDAALAATGFWI